MPAIQKRLASITAPSILAKIKWLSVSVALICFAFIALNVAFLFKDPGCFLRYPDSNGYIVQTNTVVLQGNGKYTDNPNVYGRWIKVPIDGMQDKIELEVTGNVSLCLAKLPEDNVYQKSNLKKNTKTGKYDQTVVIPRFFQNSSDFLTIPFAAGVNEWYNLTEVEKHDEVNVLLLPSTLDSNYILQNPFDEARPLSANCSAGQLAYSPICGRYAMYGGQYIASCKLSEDYDKIRPPKTNGRGVTEQVCTRILLDAIDYDIDDIFPKSDLSICCEEFTQVCDCSKYTDPKELRYFDPRTEKTDSFWTPQKVCLVNNCHMHSGYCTHPEICESWDEKAHTCTPSRNCDTDDAHDIGRVCLCAPYLLVERAEGPERYLADKSNVIKNSEVYTPDAIRNSCEKDGTFHKQRFWCLADDAAGLVYRLNAGEQIYVDPPAESRNIYLKDKDHRVDDAGKLQYLLKNASAKPNTGGYVFKIQHTKCVRKNAQKLPGDPELRGVIEYVLTPSDVKEELLPRVLDYVRILDVDADNKGVINIQKTEAVTQYLSLWMRIRNNAADYPDSVGSYSIRIKQFTKANQFDQSITKFISMIRTKIQNFGLETFQKITCNTPNDAICKAAFNKGQKIPTCQKSCIDFLFLIRILLTLYIALYGMSIVLGYVRFEPYDVTARVIKIVIVGGLLSNVTINFFASYVLPIAYNGIDYIIANISGYDVVRNGYESHPFLFLSTIIDRLANKLFWLQLLSLMFIHILGIFYFFFLVFASMRFIRAIISCLTSYVLSLLIIALLIGLAPVFLVMMLFRITYPVFANWFKFLCFYTLEPVVLFAGVSIFVQLFIVYLDYAIDYSVCWKCKLPILFWCIKWFAPWGDDGSFSFDAVGEDGGTSSSIIYILAITILSQMCTRYVEAASSITARLVGLVEVESAQKIVQDSVQHSRNTFRDVKDFVTKNSKYKKKNPASGRAVDAIDVIDDEILSDADKIDIALNMIDHVNKE